MIVEEDMVVTISNNGYIKRTPITLYQAQKGEVKEKPEWGPKKKILCPPYLLLQPIIPFCLLPIRVGYTGRKYTIFHSPPVKAGEKPLSIYSIFRKMKNLLLF
jgi:hypothetical protein